MCEFPFVAEWFNLSSGKLVVCNQGFKYAVAAHHWFQIMYECWWSHNGERIAYDDQVRFAFEFTSNFSSDPLEWSLGQWGRHQWLCLIRSIACVYGVFFTSFLICLERFGHQTETRTRCRQCSRPMWPICSRSSINLMQVGMTDVVSVHRVHSFALMFALVVLLTYWWLWNIRPNIGRQN